MVKMAVDIVYGNRKRTMPISAIGFTHNAVATATGYETKSCITKGIIEYGVSNVERDAIMSEAAHSWRCRVWATIAEHEGRQFNDFNVVGKYRDVDVHITTQVQELLAELADDGMTVTGHGYTVKVIG